MKEERITCPRDCYDTCSLIVQFDEKARLKSIRGDPYHPITKGILCPRGIKNIEHVYKNRVLYPYVRNNISEKPKKSSWENAIDIISKKLKETLDQEGPNSVLHIDFAGNGGLLTWDYPLRLWNMLGAAQTDYSICTKSGHNAISLHYGKSYGRTPEDFLNQKLIVLWGFNASESAMHLWNLCKKARKRNNTVIVSIDPRKTETAKQSDLWINPFPNSDTYLALAISKYLIVNDYIDKTFIKNWTIGFEKFTELTDNIEFDNLERICGIKKEEFEQLANLYATLKPNISMIGIGLSKSLYGAQSVRAISLIPALSGIHRGFFFSNDQAYFVDKNSIRLESCNKKQKSISQVNIAEDLKKNNIKFIYIYNSNPLISLPNQSVFRDYLKKEEIFTVVHDSHWTATCDFANVILPATTFLEKQDIIIPWTHPYVQYNSKLTQPLGESKNEIWLMKRISENLSLKNKELWENPLNIVKNALKDSFEKGSFEDLLNGERLKLKQRKINDYQTPSSKIEFYSKIAESKQIDPLPSIKNLQIKPSEFILLTSSLRNYTHSQFQEIYGKIPPIFKINPIDAKNLKIKDNMEVKIYNFNGSVNLKCRISDSIKQGMLWTPKLVTDVNGIPINVLTSSSPQEIGEGSSFNSTRVKIR